MNEIVISYTVNPDHMPPLSKREIHQECKTFIHGFYLLTDVLNNRYSRDCSDDDMNSDDLNAEIAIFVDADEEEDGFDAPIIMISSPKFRDPAELKKLNVFINYSMLEVIRLLKIPFVLTIQVAE